MLKPSRLKIPVLHGQVSLFNRALKNPYNDWTDLHVSQGFSYRRKSVSFALPSATLLVDVHLQSLPASELIGRHFRLPFDVEGTEGIEFGNVIDTVHFPLEEGRYTIDFALYKPYAETTSAGLVISVGDCEAQIVQADEALATPDELHLQAQPAL